MLQLAASVEQASEHPLAQAIVKEAKVRGLAVAKVKGFDSPTGNGIAMGTGTDVAIEGAGLTLPRGGLASLAKAYSLSRATMGHFRQNLFLAFIYNAANVHYPAFGILLPANIAAAMARSSVSVIGNALRLRAAKL